MNGIKKGNIALFIQIIKQREGKGRGKKRREVGRRREGEREVRLLTLWRQGFLVPIASECPVHKWTHRTLNKFNTLNYGKKFFTIDIV